MQWHGQKHFNVPVFLNNIQALSYSFTEKSSNGMGVMVFKLKQQLLQCAVFLKGKKREGMVYINPSPEQFVKRGSFVK